MARKIEIPNLDDLVVRYLAGASLLQLQNESGVHRNVLTRRFREMNVPLRSQSEQEYLKWERLIQDRDAVVRQMSGAWTGRRGNVDPLSRKIARAKTNYLRLTRIGKWERELVTALVADGLTADTQTPLGPYNLDVTISPPGIAVEVQSAYMSGGKSLKPQRLEYILNNGWSLIIIDAGKGIDFARMTEYLHALADMQSRNPALVGQYDVVDGNAKSITVRSLDLAGRTRIGSAKTCYETT